MDSSSNLNPLNEDVAATLASAKGLAHWIATRQDGLEVKKGGHARISATLLDLALEHHVGIVHLLDARIYGSAFALLRIEFEAFIRATWLQQCATPKELNAFEKNDTFNLTFGQMINAIEKHQDFQGKVLSGLKESAWKAMNSYTHGGLHQVTRRMKNGNIEPNYEPDEVIEVLKASGYLALLALLQIARLAENVDLEKEVNTKLRG
jgi:hypothetical protein